MCLCVAAVSMCACLTTGLHGTACQPQANRSVCRRKGAGEQNGTKGTREFMPGTLAVTCNSHSVQTLAHMQAVWPALMARLSVGSQIAWNQCMEMEKGRENVQRMFEDVSDMMRRQLSLHEQGCVCMYGKSGLALSSTRASCLTPLAVTLLCSSVPSFHSLMILNANPRERVRERERESEPWTTADAEEHDCKVSPAVMWVHRPHIMKTDSETRNASKASIFSLSLSLSLLPMTVACMLALETRRGRASTLRVSLGTETD